MSLIVIQSPMELINDLHRLQHVVATSQLCLLYILAPDCGLCSLMLDKIDAVAQQFDKLSSARVELHVVPQVAGTFLVATAPTVLLFAQGKEVYRAGNFIDVSELQQVLTKWHTAPIWQP